MYELSQIPQECLQNILKISMVNAAFTMQKTDRVNNVSSQTVLDVYPLLTAQ